MVYSLSKLILRVALRALCGFRVEGGDHEPASGPVIVVCNHRSDLDPLVAGSALRRRVMFMAKQELFRVPGVRWWVTSCGAFPVRRGEPDRQALRTSLRILEGGGVLVMFPEGTRATGRELRPPEPGAALLALRTGATILPVAIDGTDVVLPRGARRPRLGAISVRIGAPIGVANPSGRPDGRRPGREEIDALGQRYMGELARLLA